MAVEKQYLSDVKRFKIYPKGSIYPCQTAIAANVLCHMGYVEDDRLLKTFRHFLDMQYLDGGWRCNKFFFRTWRGNRVFQPKAHPKCT